MPAKQDNKKRVLLSWSSGKDSALALHVLRQSPDVDVVGLLTTINSTFNRVAMHAVRTDLVWQQAQSIGLPLLTIPLEWPCSNDTYESMMSQAIVDAREKFDITHVAFGDLFLEDIRAYREEKLQGTGLTPLFPLWLRPTHALAREMVDSGLRAIVTCVDPRCLDESFAGRFFDHSLLDELPSSVDPCGENGEFHTFAFAGPMFQTPIAVTVGEIVRRDGFVFADVVGEPSDESLIN